MQSMGVLNFTRNRTILPNLANRLNRAINKVSWSKLRSRVMTRPAARHAIGLAARAIKPRHAFGSGFGYTRFALEGAAIHDDGADGWTVTANVRNTGERAGAEVVQVYRAQPELTLVGFAKVRLAPGEARAVRIPIARRRLEVWDGGWARLPGRVDLLVGRSSADLPLELQVF